VLSASSALADVYACDDAKDKFVRDFAAQDKVMSLDSTIYSLRK
jgi:catalase (peroxidase I)